MAHNYYYESDLHHSRFDDFSDEPLQMLNPIKGFEKKPLVSLKDSVRPITYLFNSIEQYIWISKENCKYPADGLTQDESASIHLYTMEFQPGPSLYRVLNRTLRSRDRGALTPWFLYLRLFLTALNKLPSHSCKVWRGMRGVDIVSRYKQGESFVWWGVSSTTESLGVIESQNFLGSFGPRTIFAINCRNGKKIAAHSYFEDEEQEVLLLPGSSFRIKGVINQPGGLYIVDIEETNSSYPFPLVGIPANSMNKSKILVKAQLYM